MKQYFQILFLVLLLYGCQDDSVTTTPPPTEQPTIQPIPYAAYILNEGEESDPFGARLTMYDIDNDSVYYNVFESGNTGYHLGSVGGDMKYLRGRLYILMRRSQNLEVVRVSDHRRTQEYYFSTVPHQIVIDSNRSKAYISQYFSNLVYVLNLTSFVLQDSFYAGSTPNGMALNSNNLYVCNSGYHSDSTTSIYDSTIAVVDLNTDTVKATITVGKGPNCAALLPNGNIVISCRGEGTSTGSLAIINQNTNTVIDTISLPDNPFGSMVVDTNGVVYVLGGLTGGKYGGAVHKVDPLTKQVTPNYIAGTFYSIALEDSTQDFYLTDVKQFSTNGEIQIYRNNGTLKGFFRAQKGPRIIVFRK